jgi:YVTN family beta-propeller protein
MVTMAGIFLAACFLGAGEAGEPASAAVQLFNGENLDGWYTFIKARGRDVDPKGVFTVRDGLIRISGEEWGCITSEKEFENYHLVLEFKWGGATHAPRVDRARDSGLLLHSVGEDGGYSGIWMHSIECQIIEGGTGDFIVVGDGTDKYSITCPAAEEKQGSCSVFHPDGEPVTINGGRINWYGRDPGWKDVIDFRGAQDVEKPVGEWNRLECITSGGKITVILNGVVVNRAIDAQPQKGRIQIQSEGAEMLVRRVELTPYDETAAARRPRRLIYNCDGGNTFIYDDPPMTPDNVHKYVDEVAAAGATTFFMCPNIGMDVNFPSEVGGMIGSHASPALEAKFTGGTGLKTLERSVVNMRALVEAGHDPMKTVLDRARKKGMEAFVTFRPNEVHCVEHEANADRAEQLLLSQFWLDHPEWRIGKAGDPLPQVYLDILGPNTSPVVAGWLAAGLDFGMAEVRAHRLAQLRECCERYDIDGLDIDFQRFPMYFKPGEEMKHVETMTGWLREVRAMTQEVGAKRGRPLLLSARVMARPAQNLAIGLDPVTWVKEDLLDFIVVSHYLHNNFALPIKEYRKLFPDKLPLYASIEVAPDRDTYRNIARQLWQDGVDGILLYNFFTTRERGKEPPFDVIKELGNPAVLGCKAASGKPMLLVANKHSNTLSYIDLETLEVVDTVPTGPNPHEMAITPDQRFMYLSNYAAPGDTISLVDLVARKHIKQIPTGEYTRIHGTTMAPDGKHAYFTAGQTGFVVEVDTKTNAVTRGIPSHGKISHMVLVSRDNKRLYTANITSENVSVIDRASGDLMLQIPCGKGVEGMAFTPDGKYLWAANQTGGSIAIIDLAQHKVIETFDCPGMPVRIRFSDDGKRAYVPSWTPEGVLIVIDTKTKKEIKRIPVGGNAIGVELSPDGKRAFVGCEYTDGLHVINTASLEVEKVIKTGDGPDPMLMWYPPAN